MGSSNLEHYFFPYAQVNVIMSQKWLVTLFNLNMHQKMFRFRKVTHQPQN